MLENIWVDRTETELTNIDILDCASRAVSLCSKGGVRGVACSELIGNVMGKIWCTREVPCICGKNHDTEIETLLKNYSFKKPTDKEKYAMLQTDAKRLEFIAKKLGLV